MSGGSQLFNRRIQGKPPSAFSIEARQGINSDHAQVQTAKDFYSRYKALRAGLFQSMKAGNPQMGEMALFQISQKIAVRFVIVCFCESMGLLPPGSFRAVAEAGGGTQASLWERLRCILKEKGYSGGLFREDCDLDSLKIPSAVLGQLAKLSDDGFCGGLDVNILGHIFEQGVADLGQALAEVNGTKVKRQKGKRKSDGIYYTPAYVARYMVERTIGAWLAEKRNESGLDNLPALDDADYCTIQIKKGKTSYNEKIAVHVKAWEAYKEALHNIKVLDPACGSGALLNEAFDYLMSEGRAIDEKLSMLFQSQTQAEIIAKPQKGEAKPTGQDVHVGRKTSNAAAQTASLIVNCPLSIANFLGIATGSAISHWGSHILANNIFGVDISRESADITKLSLWLKTANQNEPLAYLDDNIKVGNSLIGDTDIAGDMAFDWRNEFPEIMASGGFDVVLGNPPYGAVLSQAEKDYISDNYQTTEYNFDTYKTFMELGLKLTKRGGYMGYITPNTYFVLEQGANKLRKFLFENYTLLNIAEIFNVFPEAVVEPAISIFKNAKPKNSGQLEVISVPRKADIRSPFISDGISTMFAQSDLREKEGYLFNFRETEIEKQLIEKINKIARPLSNFFKVSAGMIPYEENKGTPPQTRETVDTKPFEGNEKIDSTWMPYIRGRTIERYTDKWDGEYIKYGEWLAAPRNFGMFKNEKLFVRQTGDCPIATYDASGKIGNKTIHCIYHHDERSSISLKYALGLLNSRMMKWLFQHENVYLVGKPHAEVLKIYVERLPIVVAPDQSAMVSCVDGLLENCQARFNKTKQFIDYITATYAPKSISKKLLDFYKLDFNGFIKEMKKQRANLGPSQEKELMTLFRGRRDEIAVLSKTIDRLDNEIDQMAYALYGFSADEIAIVEGR